MSDLNEKTVEFTMEDHYLASVVPRVQALESIMERIMPGAEVGQIMGDNGFPFLRVSIDDDVIDLKYFPVGEPGEGRYIMMIQSVVFDSLDEDRGYHMDCASFNFGSAFGFAVYDPVKNTIELRAQLPETEGMSEDEHYENLIAMFLYGIDELKNDVVEH